VQRAHGPVDLQSAGHQRAVEENKNDAHLGISQRNVKLPLLQVYLPHVAVLVVDNQLEERLVRIYPICLPDRVGSEALDLLIWFLVSASD
jgi:hypothetical protein